eukprot:CAMPEP_0184708590 /NCGR_PEP_ID=MMETSP0313-20130426/37856_1 /TAXON_ID=2792 /ORGANISM="Porphyridium aerugineum, Strain SAG 1380-2" /LENGTH=234 /DNA_ID=CAMNT_0027170187 /DNA_START=20 /DNA_END=724 /DNA_ORIENTATION=+
MVAPPLWNPLHPLAVKRPDLKHLYQFFSRMVWRHPTAYRMIEPWKEWRMPLVGKQVDANAKSKGIFFYPPDASTKTAAWASGPLGETMQATGKARLEITRRFTDDNSAVAPEMSEWGGGPLLMRSQKLLEGVETGFAVTLELHGVGFRAEEVPAENRLDLRLGFANTLSLPLTAPNGVKYRVLEPQKIQVYGINYQDVHQAAVNVRKLRKPEPYKGKGIRYENEDVYRKKINKK